MNFKVGDIVKTRDGREVEILKVDAPGRLPVVGMFVETGHACTWHEDGRFYEGLTRDEDLTSPPKRTREVVVYVNVYSDGAYSYNSVEEAKNSASFYETEPLAVAVPATFTVEW